MQKTQVKAKVFDLFSSDAEKRVVQRSKVYSQERRKDDPEFYGTKRVGFKGRKSKGAP